MVRGGCGCLCCAAPLGLRAAGRLWLHVLCLAGGGLPGACGVRVCSGTHCCFTQPACVCSCTHCCSMRPACACAHAGMGAFAFGADLKFDTANAAARIAAPRGLLCLRVRTHAGMGAFAFGADLKFDTSKANAAAADAAAVAVAASGGAACTRVCRCLLCW